jgi:hypothetical protein
MFHSNTELLIDYWRAKKGRAALPARVQVDPSEFAALLPQTFIAGRSGAGIYPLRLAGEFMVELHGRGLRGEDLAHLWIRQHRLELTAALEAALRDPEPVVISAEGRADDGPLLRLEVLFAPLSGPSGRPDRFIGLYQPTSAAGAMSGRPVRELAIRAVGGAVIATDAPRLRLAALDGRRIA